MLRVVAALIEKDGKILIAKRAKGKYENMWEFPGGKVEFGETEETAIEREIKEEFDIEIKAFKFIKNNVHDYPDITIDLRLYLCKYVSGEIKLSEHKEYKWIDRQEILNYELAPADIKLAEYIKEM